ncbi:MAG: hypothetical protein KAG72_13520 [Abyssibacter sp.]|nr:hypothetical protein [Abyssibacter sp.]MCK5860364.1 hypothetical protein [Abyssibacter sp.]
MNKVEPPTKRQLAEALSEWNENGAIERTLHNCGEAHIASGELPQICVEALTGDLIIAASREQGVLPLGWPIVNAEAEWLEEDCLARGLDAPDPNDGDEVIDAMRDLHECFKKELRAAIAATPVDKLEDIDALTEIFRRLEDECSQQLEMWHYERAG